ncbi:MAG: NUDIX hydrolase [Cyanophyceae cyanobacterium]
MASTAVTLAILHRTDGAEPAFLMQLRDDFPHILYPGVWGFFGGHIEADEDPLPALQRELIEEIGHCPDGLTLCREEPDSDYHRYFFAAPCSIPRDALHLGEGMDLDWVPLGDVQLGRHLSPQLQEARPLGSPHQAVLLWFARDRGWL